MSFEHLFLENSIFTFKTIVIEVTYSIEHFEFVGNYMNCEKSVDIVKEECENLIFMIQETRESLYLD